MVAPQSDTHPTLTLSRRTVLGAGVGVLAAGCLGAVPVPAASADTTSRTGTEFRTVYETSFEVDEAQWPTGPASYDTSQAYTGQRSLAFRRTDPTEYVIVGHRLAAVPGQTYRVSVWVKTAQLSAGTGGAAVAVEGYTADNAWVSGGYSAQSRHTEWTEISATYVPKPNVAEVQISLYLPRGITGTVWYDDLSLSVPQPRPMRSELRTPSYRGWLVPGDHDEIWVHTLIGLGADQWSGHRLRTELLDADGIVTRSETAAIAAGIDVRWPAAPLAVGRHTVRITLETAAGTTVRSEQWALEKLAQVPPTYVDRHRRLIRNGEPFFPLGLYNNTVDAETIDNLAGTSFNTVLSYGALNRERLDLLHANGLTGIFSLKDYYAEAQWRPARIRTVADEVPAIRDTVAQFRDHPALLAWYLNDEKDITLYGHRMADHKDAVVAADPNHPTYGVEYRNVGVQAGDYLRTMDVFGKDSYPVYGNENDNIGQCTERAGEAAATMPAAAMWHVPQSFGWGAFAGRTGRFPTHTEFRNMTWQMITAGAMGLIWYELYYMRRDPDLTFAECMAIAETTVSEVAALVPALLSIEAAPSVTVPEATWLNHAVRARGRTGHLFTVSRSRELQQLTVQIPAAVSVRVPDQNREIPVSPEGSVTDTFDPLAVHLYEIVLANYDDQRRLSAEFLAGQESPRAAGLARAMRSILTDAETAASAGNTAKVDDLLSAYRTLVTGPAAELLSVDEGQTLLRLSHHLPRS